MWRSEGWLHGEGIDAVAMGLKWVLKRALTRADSSAILAGQSRTYCVNRGCVFPGSFGSPYLFKPRVKVRLGFVNTAGQQKGVDSLVVTDMITLARNRAMVDAVLLSGDEDLRVGVQQAQEFGVRVHLLGFKPSRGSQSQFLLQEADSTHEWTEVEVATFLTYQPKSVTAMPLPGACSPPAPLGTAVAALPAAEIDSVAAEVARDVASDTVDALLATYRSSRQIPSDIDRPLLGKARVRFGRLLRPEEKRRLREALVAVLERLHARKGS